MAQLIHKELSGKIIGAALTILNDLKPGLDEKLYERALCIELQEAGHSVEEQKRFRVDYKGQFIGSLIPDLIVDDFVIVDTKVVSEFNDTHVAQMMGYLAITDLELALLLSFKNAKLKLQRIGRDHEKWYT